MSQLLEEFRELPDYRKCKQLKFSDVYVSFGIIGRSKWVCRHRDVDKIKEERTKRCTRTWIYNTSSKYNTKCIFKYRPCILR